MQKQTTTLEALDAELAALAREVFRLGVRLARWSPGAHVALARCGASLARARARLRSDGFPRRRKEASDGR